MREAVFTRRSADRWKQFEQALGARSADPDALADLYVHVTDDLAYARTFYPNSATTDYLNGLAARAHHRIYRSRREDRGRLVRFWTDELPRLVYAERRALRAAAVVFLLAFAIGTLSAANDPSFVRLIMGDAYVNMTLDNIERGDPMAVYKQMNEVDMFLGITLNNVYVSFLAFVFGVFTSFGTAYLLLKNGVMLGAFQLFFHQHGLLAESVLTIWIHGTLEISAIILAGGAGFVVGNSLLFPGTYPRLTAFRRGAKNGLKLVVGLVPVFVAAGFLEGFVTRHTEMPLGLSLVIILGSLAAVVGYFVVYPIRLHRRDAAEAQRALAHG
ncbi:MAG: stage II sporulation protein M [Rhodothermales bacterium]